jgi:hypothetical protein
MAKRRRGEGGRDLVKVAQYEVLGNDAKKKCPSRKRKGRSKHWAPGLAVTSVSQGTIPVQKQLARPRVLSWLRREVLGSGVEVA